MGESASSVKLSRKYQHVYHSLETTWHSFGRVRASICGQFVYCPCQLNIFVYQCMRFHFLSFWGLWLCCSACCLVLLSVFAGLHAGPTQTLHPAQQHSKERRSTTRSKCRGSCTNRDIHTVVSICHITVRGQTAQTYMSHVTGKTACKYRQIRFQIPGLKTANISLTAAEIR